VPVPAGDLSQDATALEQDRARRSAAAQPMDLTALATEQGVGPTDSIRDLRGQFWPDDELVDKFLSEIRVLRRQNGGQIIP